MTFNLFDPSTWPPELMSTLTGAVSAVSPVAGAAMSNPEGAAAGAAGALSPFGALIGSNPEAALRGATAAVSPAVYGAAEAPILKEFTGGGAPSAGGAHQPLPGFFPYPPPMGGKPAGPQQLSPGWQQAMGMLPKYGGQQLTPNAELTKWGLFASPAQGGTPPPFGGAIPPGFDIPIKNPMPSPVPRPTYQPHPGPSTGGAGTAAPGIPLPPTYSGPMRPGAAIDPLRYQGGNLPPYSPGGLQPSPYPVPPTLDGYGGLPALSDPAVQAKGRTGITGTYRAPPPPQPLGTTVTGDATGGAPTAYATPVTTSIANPTVRTPTNSTKLGSGGKMGLF